MVKVVIYSHCFAPSVGGVETSVEGLARGLTRWKGVHGSPEFEIVVVTNTTAGEFDDHALPFPVVRSPSLLELLGLVYRAHVLHLAGPALLPLLLAKIFRKPTVVEHHGYQAICLNGALLHEPDRAVCPGHFQAGRLGECFRCQRSELSSALKSLRRMILTKLRNALPGSRVIYHGIEDVLKGETVASTVSSFPPQLCFAYVGRFVSEKGVHVLLDAAARLQKEGYEFDVLLIGDGPDRTKLEGEIERQGLGSRVRITGFLRGPQLSSLLQEVHVVVMPSVCEETAGLAAIEQMMRGRLVIASAIGGLGEVVGSAGIVCPPGDAEALAGCMSAVITHPERIAALGSKARERALSTFGYARMLEEHAQVYRQAASKHRV